MRKAERKAHIHGVLTRVNHRMGYPLESWGKDGYNVGALDFQYDGDQSNSYSIYQIINKSGGRWTIYRETKLSDIHTYAEGMASALDIQKNPHPNLAIKPHEQQS